MDSTNGERMRKKLFQGAENNGIKRTYQVVQHLNKTHEVNLNRSMLGITAECKQNQNWLQINKTRFLKLRRKSMRIAHEVEGKLEKIKCNDRPKSLKIERLLNTNKQYDQGERAAFPKAALSSLDQDCDSEDDVKSDPGRATSASVDGNTRGASTGSDQGEEDEPGAETESSFGDDEDEQVQHRESFLELITSLHTSKKDCEINEFSKASKTEKPRTFLTRSYMSRKPLAIKSFTNSPDVDNRPRFSVPEFKRHPPIRVEMRRNIGYDDIPLRKLRRPTIDQQAAQPMQVVRKTNEIGSKDDKQHAVSRDSKDEFEFPLHLALTIEERIQHRIKEMQKEVERTKERHKMTEQKDCLSKFETWIQKSDRLMKENKEKKRGDKMNLYHVSPSLKHPF